MFSFFLKSYRSGILDFCGSGVNVTYEKTGPNGKYGFRLFDDGQMNIHELKSCHPNILKSVIIGKKSWGLHLKMWSEGISEGTFTQREILEQFHQNNIEIPQKLMDEFDNLVKKKVLERLS